VPGTFKDVPVIGPTTSINGLRLGPGYYYFNLPAYWIGGGDPQVLIYWNILWFLLGGMAIIGYYYKKDFMLGVLISAVYLLAPMLFDTTRYFWNAHSMIYSMVLYFLALVNFFEKRDNKSAIFLGIASGISMHFEAAMGVVAVLYAMMVSVVLLKKRSWYFFLGLIPWFLPQIAVEVAKGFSMSRLLIQEILHPQMLGDKLTFWETWQSHVKVFGSYFEGQFILPFGWGKLVLLISMILGLCSQKTRKTTWLLTSFVLFCFCFYLFTYRHELKIWYADGLRVWYVFVVGYGQYAWLSAGQKYKPIIQILLFLILLRSLYTTYIDQRQYIDNRNFAKDDPKLASHEIEVVDWVYKNSLGEGFKAYTYVPEIYDYPYQYLYWWRGKTKYGYTPEEITYEPGAPNYVPRQEEFYADAKKSNGILALVYERKSNFESWLDKFGGWCTYKKSEFDWKVTAELRKPCK